MTAPGPGEADEDVGAGERLVGRAGEAVGIRALREQRLPGAEVVAAEVDRALPVAADDRADTEAEQHVGRRDAGRADAGQDDPHVLGPLADELAAR